MLLNCLPYVFKGIAKSPAAPFQLLEGQAGPAQVETQKQATESGPPALFMPVP